jgi:phosphinothricin acetyltransferase
MTYRYEPLDETHRVPVIDIFNHYIAHTFAAYPDGDELVPYAFFDRLLEMSRGYPAYAVRDGAGSFVGFGLLRPYRPGRAFRRCAELTYFIAPEHVRCGVGTALLDRLKGEARAQGVCTLLASVSSRNEASLAFHQKHGFAERGRLRQIGEKLGKTFDVVWLRLDIERSASSSRLCARSEAWPQARDEPRGSRLRLTMRGGGEPAVPAGAGLAAGEP